MAKLKASQHAAVFSQSVSYTCSTISLCYPTAKLDSGCCYRDQILIQQCLLYNRQILAVMVMKIWCNYICLCYPTAKLDSGCCCRDQILIRRCLSLFYNHQTELVLLWHDIPVSAHVVVGSCMIEMKKMSALHTPP